MNKYLRNALTLSLVFISALLHAQSQATPDIAALKKLKDGKYVFNVSKPDFKLSPHTGMTRQHWEDAALYLLDGAFSYISKLEAPMVFPKQPGKSYPKDGVHTPTEMLEGLCRTLFIAAPLLKENPELVLNNIKVADYYRYHIGKLVDPTSVTYIKPRAKNGGPSQILVEFGALSISLFTIPDILWHPLPAQQKETLAATMISYGDGPTVPSNWKFFNIFVLSFFKDQGYKVNENLLEEYLTKSLEHYRGDGWYNDNPAYDYYSMWAFQMYGVLWTEFFGNTNYPEFSKKFIANFRDLKNNYPYMFSRDGEMIMWGRSISYRMGSIVPFPFMGFLNDADVNYGWLRRISSGVMLQFLQNPDFLQDNVPTLGFYGAFEPAVQAYSCRGSAYWMGKAFLALLLPKDNVFWTATENNGAWEKELKGKKVFNNFQDSSNILITNYPQIGASEVRAWCNVKVVGNWEAFRGSENYNRLAYNSAFPWQADGENGEVAMNYVFKNKKNEWEAARLFTFRKYEDGVYYRDVVLETNKNIHLRLADIPLYNGILRIDKNTSTEPVEVRLGHYSLPELSQPVKKSSRKVKGINVQIIDNGEYQLAMIPLSGWDDMQTLDTKGLNPVDDNSIIINVSDSFVPQNAGQQLYATLMLWKKSGESWSDDELAPVKKLKYSSKDNSINISLKNGGSKKINFN
mgnify:CR=1 FL=1